MKRWWHPLAAILGVTIAVDVLMVVTDMGPNVALVAALGCLVGIGLWFVSDLADIAVSAVGQARRPASQQAVRADHRVMQLRTGLAFGQADRTSLVRLHSTLAELVADQLRTVHHVDLIGDPDAARAIVGEELFAFVDDDASAGMLADVRKVDHILTLIERV